MLKMIRAAIGRTPTPPFASTTTCEQESEATKRVRSLPKCTNSSCLQSTAVMHVYYDLSCWNCQTHLGRAPFRQVPGG